MLRPTEVAELLAVSRAWVYEAASSGRIPSVRIGGPDGPLRFVVEDVERWLLDARSLWTPGLRGGTGRSSRRPTVKACPSPPANARHRESAEPQTEQQSLL